MKHILVATTLLTPCIASAQLSPVPGLPASTLNRPNGPAQLDPNGRASSLAVLPAGSTTARTLAQRLGDSVSILDFGAACDGVADDSPALYAATVALAATDATIQVPRTCRLKLGPAARLAGHPIILDGVGLAGEGGRDSGQGALGYGTRGSTILLTDPAACAFVARRNWSLRRLTFFWPGETEAAAVAAGGTPPTMPPLLCGSSNSGIAGMPASEVSAGEFADNDVLNAWDVMDFSADTTGGLRVHDNRAYFMDNFLRLKQMPLESFVSSNQFTPNAFFAALGVGVGPTYNLRNYAAANASVVQAVGNGTATKVPSATVDGLKFTNNYVFGLGYGFRVSGGGFNLLSAIGNDFDGVAHILAAETGGWVPTSLISGGSWTVYTYGSQAMTYALSMASDAAPNNSLQIAAVKVPSTLGGLIDVESAGVNLSLSEVMATGLNNGGGTQSGVRINAQGGRLSITSSILTMQGSSPGPCIDIQAPLQTLLVVGNTFITCSAPLYVGGSFPPTVAAVTGNVSVATHGSSAYTGSAAGSLMSVGNTWDVPPPGWTVTPFRPADGAMVFSYGGTDQAALLPFGLGLRLLGNLTVGVKP